ncbi:uncharacterized protein LOC141639346 isoform X2 [Silene latifolia]|uniref:uncharacterized protein LOC141639346 isoform X2 n=1 Tax=Silene latifolia TaxID=37657 RepID=UPI003D776718
MYNRIDTLFSIFIFVVTFSPLITSQQQQQQQSQPEPEDDPITRFQTYLRFNTAHPNPNYTGPVSFLKARAHSIGLQSRTLEYAPDKPVLLLTWPGTRPELPSILLNSHMDSVPAEPDKWAHPPFSAVRTSDGRIYARGAQDDKCIAVQYLEAIRNLRERGFNPIRTVHLSFVPEEEIGGFDGAAMFVPSEEFEELNVGFAMDEGQGYAMNMQPSEAEAGFDIRIPPTVDPELIRKRIIEEWAPASRNMTYQIVVKGPNRDYQGRPLMTATDDTNPWWSVFHKAVTAVGGKLAKPEILASTTDARFVRYRGIPALGFSPMNNTPILLHDHNEFLQDKVFSRGIKVYESIISSLSSYEGVHSA